MVIQDLMKSISLCLTTFFYTQMNPILIYMSQVPQGFETPAFLINLIYYRKQRNLSNRFEVWTTFEIVYFEDMNTLIPNVIESVPFVNLAEIGESLTLALLNLPFYEFDVIVPLFICSLAATNMNFKILSVGTDGHNSNPTLHFYVDYHFFVQMSQEKKKMYRLYVRNNIK